jgi:hypothetical protein
MSPFRRRKRSYSRSRSRRRELIERERRSYERGLDEGEELPPVEDASAVEQAPPEVEEAPPEVEPARPEVEEPKRGPARRPPGIRRPPRAPRPAPRPPAGRRPRRRRRRTARLGGLREASASGARATVRQARPAVSRLAGRTGRLLGWLLAWPLRLAGLLERLILALVDGLVIVGGKMLELGQRHATPERMLVLVIGAAGGLLIYSQFVAYRGVEVGQPQYSQVDTVAPPPQTDRIDAGEAHAYVLVPLAAIAVVLAVIALISGRWRLGRLVSLAGLIGIAVSLAIDLPKGLDAGTAGTAFAGAKATLTEGFYAQLAASAVLVLCGWLLAANLRLRAGAPAKRRRLRRSKPRPRRAPSVAGGGA